MLPSFPKQNKKINCLLLMYCCLQNGTFTIDFYALTKIMTLYSYESTFYNNSYGDNFIL